MKKRLLSLVLCLVMVFSLLPFGASAQVYLFEGNAIQVEFYKNSTETKPANTQRVLANGIESIYDPGCELAENTVFLGWQVNGEGDVMDIAAVRNYVTANAERLTGKTLKLVASVSPVRYLVYNDESGRVVKTVAVILARNNNSWETDVDYDYTPANVNSDFFGWKTSKTGTDVQYENKSVEKPTHPTKITLGENETNTTNLYPVCKSGYWVTFNESDKWTKDGVNVNIHATYQPPVFVLDGETLNPNSGEYPVSAQGYTFDGWYDEDGNRVTEVSEATTVFAKWTAQSVKYKIAYWQQNANDDGYSVVANSIYETTGTAGEIATYNKNADPYDHFTLNETKTDNEKVVIAGDGSTVKNVYFDRDKFTLTFNYHKQYVTINQTFYLYKQEEDGTYRYTFNAGTYELSAFDGYLMNYQGQLDTCVEDGDFWYNTGTGDYNYSYVSIRTESAWTSAKTITAKYDEYIGDQFPITNDGARWMPQNAQTYKKVLVFIGNMPAESVTFNKDMEVTTTRYMEFYVEALPGETGTTYSFGGKTFVKLGNTIPANYGYFTEAEDFPNLTGYSHYGSNPAFSDGRADVDVGGTLKLYYTRNEHTLSFDTGDSVKPADVTGIKFDEPMASHDPGYKIGDTRDRNGRPIIFQGWYDNAAYAGSPYDFSAKKMPDADVMLYAKWADARYAVELMLDGGQMPEGSASKFKVDYNGTVDITNNPTKVVGDKEYEFVGWYTDPELTQRFNLDTHLNETVVKNTTPDPDDSTVHGKLTLYAKWRSKMDSETYLTVVYDADNGTINGAKTYTDPLHYADQAEAIAQPAAKSAEDGKTFSCWKVVGSNVTVNPGDIFNVKMDNAQSNVVTLKAVYVSEQKIDVTWFGNGGVTADGETSVKSADANLNAAITVKPADTFTREGFEFLGWAKLNVKDMKDGDGWKQNDALTEQDLWLIWDGEKYIANEGSRPENPDIAANNDPELHVLYAVWEQKVPATYLIDFGAQMKLAENGKIKNGTATEKNGKFSIVNGAAVYQLKADETIAGGANLVMSGADSATIRGNFYAKDNEGKMVAAAKAAWKDVTVVPASSVYFDDSFTAPITVGDGSGFNSELDGKNVDSTADPAQGRMTFTFYGTRADFYCTTTTTGQTVRAYITDSTGAVKKTVSMKNQSTDERYNVPTVSFDMGTPDTYTVTFVDLYADYKIDGVRVYNSVSELAGTEEANAHYIKLHDKLVSSIEAGEVKEGVMFHMDKAGAGISEYAKEGPKNEIYLDKDEYVAFEIENFDAYTGTPKVMVGLSVQGAANGTVQLNGKASQDVKSVIDEYYVVDVAKTGDTAGIVFIKNPGDERIAVTNLKITGVTGVDVNYNSTSEYATTLSVAEEPAAQTEAFEPRLIVTNRLLTFVQNPVFPAAETGTQEEPAPDPTPDPTPSFQDVIRQLLSSFVSALFGSISRLFGN